MRKPKSSKAPLPSEGQPPGGRAWARAKQFALERGLPLQVEPPQPKTKPSTKKTRKPRRARRP